MKYFNYLMQNKIIFSKYLITFNDNKKTVMEYFFDLLVQFDDNILQEYLENTSLKNYFLKTKNFKEKDYENDCLNKFFKSLKFKLREKHIILYIIELLLKKKDIEKN